MSLSDLFFHFLFFLAFGSFIFLPLVDSRLTGATHSKLLTLICAISALISSLGLGLAKLHFDYVSLTVFFYSLILFMIWHFHKDIRSQLIYILYLMANFLAFFYFQLFDLNFLGKCTLLLSALILGVVNYTMILGHYYLVVPKLTVQPLLYGIRFYWLFLSFKIILLFPYTSILEYWKKLVSVFIAQNNPTLEFLDLADSALFLLQQLSCLIALPILSYFTYKLCRMRSTQSATGVLYVMVFFSLIAEFISCYFFMIKGVQI